VANPVVTRANVLGYRAWAHGLDRRPGGTDLVLRLGVQDTPHGSARSALAGRGASVDDATAAGTATGPLVTVWSWRGAPHLHLRADPPFLAAALWPVSDADAQKRIGTTLIKDGARRGVEAFAQAASAMRSAVTGRMLKGDVSTLVSEQIPADLTYDCASCRARHIAGSLFQQVGLAAGVQVETAGRNTYLSPLPARVRPKAVPARAEGTTAALVRYVELHAPASAASLAAFLGTTRTALRDLMPGGPEGLVEVTGPDGPGWVPEAALGRLRDAGPPRLARLLPPSDPWLQARDRELVVPEADRRKAVWGAIGNPGVLLLDGEVAGTWRARTERKRLLVTLDAFGPLRPAARREIEQEAELLAASRGSESSEVTLG
jgi:hypothetical protein